VESTIVSQDWHQRDAAILAIGNIVEGPEDASMHPFVKGVLPILLNSLSVNAVNAAGKPQWGEAHKRVRDTAAWTLAKLLAARYSLIDKEQLPRIVQVLCGALADKAQVAKNVAFVRFSQRRSCTRVSARCCHLPCAIPCLVGCLAFPGNRQFIQRIGVRR
jgi:hypothetical protein